MGHVSIRQTFSVSVRVRVRRFCANGCGEIFRNVRVGACVPPFRCGCAPHVRTLSFFVKNLFFIFLKISVKKGAGAGVSAGGRKKNGVWAHYDICTMCVRVQAKIIFGIRDFKKQKFWFSDFLNNKKCFYSRLYGTSSNSCCCQRVRKLADRGSNICKFK